MTDAVIYVVDDDPAVRDSLGLLLRLSGYEVLDFESAEAFLQGVRADRPGCLLLDLRMPGTSGLQLQKAMKERNICLPVVMITAYGDVASTRAAFIEGAVDFLEKPVDEELLLKSIDRALDRDRHRCAVDRQAAELQARLARLTSREREVMWLVANGHQNREIGAMLGISPRTIEIYKARMLEKLDAKGLPELLRLLADVPADRRT